MGECGDLGVCMKIKGKKPLICAFIPRQRSYIISL